MSEQKSLYDLTVEAQDAIETYKSPDIREWIAAIDPVLEAMNSLTIGKDYVEYIRIGQKDLDITTSYTVRNCRNTNDISLPISILRSANPIREATMFRLTHAIAKNKEAIASAQRIVESRTAELKQLEAELVKWYEWYETKTEG